MRDRVIRFLNTHGYKMLRGQALMEIKRIMGYDSKEVLPIYEAWRKEYVAI